MATSKRNHIDFSVLIAVLVLMVFSLGVVYSASSTLALRRYGESAYLLNSHVLKTLVAIAMLFVGIMIDYRKYRKLTKAALFVAVLLLMTTLGVGSAIKGAARWMHLGPISFQPSEFAKFALLFHLAALITTKGDLVKDLRRGYLPMLFWVSVVVLLVMIQPNFSTGTMILLLSLVMFYFSRVRLSHLATTAAAAVPFLILYVLVAPHALRRVEAFLGRTGTSTDSLYQLNQGILGFGNGGLFGLGPGESRQRDLFLPEAYGDFVFSIVGEEYGFIGTMVVMGLFFLIMVRGLKIARHAPDEFGRLVAVGVTATVTLYALVNAGVTLGLLPTTGLPMPFVSYGGSSLFTTAFAVGVLLNISAQTDLHPRASSLPNGVVPVDALQRKSVTVY
jgi:cell division protein FtsW